MTRLLQKYILVKIFNDKKHNVDTEFLIYKKSHVETLHQSNRFQVKVPTERAAKKIKQQTFF